MEYQRRRAKRIQDSEDEEASGQEVVVRYMNSQHLWLSTQDFHEIKRVNIVMASNLILDNSYAVGQSLLQLSC